MVHIFVYQRMVQEVIEFCDSYWNDGFIEMNQ